MPKITSQCNLPYVQSDVDEEPDETVEENLSGNRELGRYVTECLTDHISVHQRKQRDDRIWSRNK